MASPLVVAWTWALTKADLSEINEALYIAQMWVLEEFEAYLALA